MSYFVNSLRKYPSLKEKPMSAGSRSEFQPVAGVRIFFVLAMPHTLLFVFVLTAMNDATAAICKTVDGTLFNASEVVVNNFSLALQNCDITDKRVPAGNAGREAQQMSLYDRVATSKPISDISLPMATQKPVSVLIPAQEFPSSVHRKNLSVTATNISSRAKDLADRMYSVAKDYNIDPLLLHAIAHVESRHDSRAVSPAGALGLMQVMPATARRFGVNDPERELYDPLVNLKVSSIYLKKLQGLFGNDLRLVLAAYNAGENAVIKYGRQIPPYRETQAYVRNVMNHYMKLKGLR